MRKTTLAVVLALLAPAARAELASVVGFDASSVGRFRFQPSALAALRDSPETRMIHAAKPGVVAVVIAVKWADVPDDELPYDGRGLSSDIRALLPHLSPQQISVLGLPRMSRDELPDYKTLGTGTGFIVKTEDGRVVCLTNAHVVDQAAKAAAGLKLTPELHIKPSDDPFVQTAAADDAVASVAAAGKNGLDIAVLSLPATMKGGGEWTPLSLGDSETVDEGEEVWALGFPMSLNFTATRGIVSAVHATVGSNPYHSYIQTDAAVNPGNSGGPLLRLRRRKPEVIGMNSLLMSRSGASAGLNFAIESAALKRALSQYARAGALDAGDAGAVFLAGRGPEKGSVIVESLAAGGPAEKAGLKDCDVVKSVAGETLASDTENALFQVARAIKSRYPGETLKIVVVRDGTELEFSITLGKEPENPAPARAAQGR